MLKIVSAYIILGLIFFLGPSFLSYDKFNIIFYTVGILLLICTFFNFSYFLIKYKPIINPLDTLIFVIPLSITVYIYNKKIFLAFIILYLLTFFNLNVYDSADRKKYVSRIGVFSLIIGFMLLIILGMILWKIKIGGD